jgi:hypothetical protein
MISDIIQLIHDHSNIDAKLKMYKIMVKMGLLVKQNKIVYEMNFIVANNWQNTFLVYETLEEAKRAVDVLRYRFMQRNPEEYFCNKRLQDEFKTDPIVCKQTSHSLFFSIISRKPGEAISFQRIKNRYNVTFGDFHDFYMETNDSDMILDISTDNNRKIY